MKKPTDVFNHPSDILNEIARHLVRQSNAKEDEQIPTTDAVVFTLLRDNGYVKVGPKDELTCQ